MKNKDAAAFAQSMDMYGGLTKLEYAAIHLMAACVANDGLPFSYKEESQRVADLAEALLTELES